MEVMEKKLSKYRNADIVFSVKSSLVAHPLDFEECSEVLLTDGTADGF